MDGWASGVYAEAVEGLRLVNVNVTFVAAHTQESWLWEAHCAALPLENEPPSAPRAELLGDRVREHELGGLPS